MDARIVVFLLFLCLSTGYTRKNDDANDYILDQLKETDALNTAPKVQADPRPNAAIPMADAVSSSSVSSWSWDWASSSSSAV
ncbi:hypothetical protein ACROYT_G027568 [Oculina patagonica]